MGCPREGARRFMAIPDERREWIVRVANGEEYKGLSDGEFEALTDEDMDAAAREFFASVADPEELHLFAGAYNWDGGVEDLLRAVRHPLCDLGTALLVYWRGQPGSFLQYAGREGVPRSQREDYDLLREIEQRVQSGAYRSARQPFDPADDHGHDARPTPASTARHGRGLPPGMYQVVAGSDS